MTDKEVVFFYKNLLQTIQNSQKTAYRYFEKQYSYEQMYAQMLKINVVLSVHRNKQILLYTEKKLYAYSAIFSIFLSNNIWVPLSSNIPEARNLEILEQADISVVLHDGTLPAGIFDFFKNRGIDVLNLQAILSADATQEFENDVFERDEIAYIMFTSGSTGIPKGVPMTHENYINFVNNVMKTLTFEQDEVFSDFHEFAFDISIFSLFACVLSEGAFSPIIEEKDKIIPINHIMENKVTVWSSVPSIINRIKTFRPKDTILTPIRIMFLCGEPLKFDVLRYCFNNMQLKNVYNFYGLTETGVENFYHHCDPADMEKFVNFGVEPIGKPLGGNDIIITEEKELYIGGCQVTPGYLGGRSQDKFETINGIRYCKTGDIVEKHGDVYICKGRLDSQVKISGHRVELMDIEAHIAKQDNIQQVVCFVEDKNGRSILVAAIKSEGKLDFNTVVQNLQKELPGHMIPRDYLPVDTFPLNNNGKIDRNKISQIYKKS